MSNLKETRNITRIKLVAWVRTVSSKGDFLACFMPVQRPIAFPKWSDVQVFAPTTYSMTVTQPERAVHG